MDKFAVLILSNGRPNNVITIPTLKKCGYSGDIFIICDNEDEMLSEYKKLYKKDIVVFCKVDYEGKFDIMDNEKNNKCVVYARNATFDIAKKLDLDYFLVLDDDYNSFEFSFDDKLNFHPRPIKNLDNIFSLFIEYLKTATQIQTLAFGQGGDFIGGKENHSTRLVKPFRKAMNSFFCATNRPFQFVGRINEDTNTYVIEGSRGLVFFTIFQIKLEQATTQKNSGGLTEIYLELGTYIKSFYTVMLHPSSVHVATVGNIARRLHHKVKWQYTVPKILNEKHKK